MIFLHEASLRNSASGVNTELEIAGGCSTTAAGRAIQKQMYGKDRFCTSAMRHPRRLGYIRVSTKSQMPDRQIEALRAECDEIYIEHVSAVAGARPIFDTALATLVAGDIFVVMDLDRAFRSSIDAILTAEHLRKQGVTFRILSMAIDTSTPEGELYYTIIAGFAQFERRIISRRTKEGLEAARARGVVLGRRPKLTDTQVRKAHEKLDHSPCADIATALGVSRPTLQRAFKRLGLVYTASTKRKEKGS